MPMQTLFRINEIHKKNRYQGANCYNGTGRKRNWGFRLYPDFSETANNAFNGQVPSELIIILKKTNLYYTRPLRKSGQTMVISR